MHRVLIVEDEFLIASTLKKALILSGFEVCGIASTGQAAIDLAVKHSPDLVLLDICLAGELDGISAGLEIKQHISTRFMVITGNPTSQVVERASELPVIAVLAKPYRFQQVVDLIANAAAVAESDTETPG